LNHPWSYLRYGEILNVFFQVSYGPAILVWSFLNDEYTLLIPAAIQVKLETLEYRAKVHLFQQFNLKGEIYYIDSLHDETPMFSYL